MLLGHLTMQKEPFAEAPRGASIRISFQTSNHNATKFPEMISNSVGGVKGEPEKRLWTPEAAGWVVEA